MQIVRTALVNYMGALPIYQVHAVSVRLGNNGQLVYVLLGIGRIFDTSVMRSAGIDGPRESGKGSWFDAGTRQAHDNFRHGFRISLRPLPDGRQQRAKGANQ